MKPITLTEKDLQELNNFFQEMPTKYGLTLINFFNQKIQEQNVVKDELQPKTED